MRFRRASGILLHPTSLPGPFGMGDLGPEARRFVDNLASAGQRVWQVLPLNPAGYGHSPYQCFSASAGHTALISLEELVTGGLLGPTDLDAVPEFASGLADFERIIPFKSALLTKAHERFKAEGSSDIQGRFEAFCVDHAFWLNDYSAFMALKDAHDGVVWTNWPADLVRREEAVLTSWCERHADAIDRHRFWQFLFFEQWSSLKHYANERGVEVMGDIPMYVAHDSADVWSHPELFHLDDTGRPTVIAGVPPDYFSETGQLWGNPIYNWPAHEQSGYGWWVERFRMAFTLYDRVRVDHFRGFEAYWEVHAAEKTAVNGQWVEGPGEAPFRAGEAALGPLAIVAENLGIITEEVEALRKAFAFPGMAVLQFAFDGHEDNAFLPRNIEPNTVAYTGTHDNDTMLGWWRDEGGEHSTRTPEAIAQERACAESELELKEAPDAWAFMQALFASEADTVIVPLQDVLGLGSEGRMNVPGTCGGRNWRWRFDAAAPTEAAWARLATLTRESGRSVDGTGGS